MLNKTYPIFTSGKNNLNVFRVQFVHIICFMLTVKKFYNVYSYFYDDSIHDCKASSNAHQVFNFFPVLFMD